MATKKQTQVKSVVLGTDNWDRMKVVPVPSEAEDRDEVYEFAQEKGMEGWTHRPAAEATAYARKILAALGNKHVVVERAALQDFADGYEDLWSLSSIVGCGQDECDIEGSHNEDEHRGAKARNYAKVHKALKVR